MKLAAIIVAAAAAAAGVQALSFEAFTTLHGVKFSSKGEESARRAIYNMNVKKIAAHNADPKATFTMAVNQFAHLTEDEFAAAYIGGWRGPSKRANKVATEHLQTKLEDLPTSVDWVSKGAVTAVKNQEQCGSCWAFSTTGSVEGITYIKTGQLPSLSEQQLVDCSGSAGNQGCNGGLMDNAFEWIVQNGGLCSEQEYPYTAADGSCKQCTAVATISGHVDVPVDSDSAMMSALVQQPVSIAIEADQTSFQFYSGGVMTGSCGTQLDHGVLAVGYGSLNGQDYYKVKNSWGASWGMSGYILLGRGSQFNGGAGQCGMLGTPSYPTK